VWPAAVAVLVVLVAACLLATVTRRSALPLVPLAPLAVAAYGLYRGRSATERRAALNWVVVLSLGVAVAFWLIGFIARTLD
jgi:nitric oxide reductase large subunit